MSALMKIAAILAASLLGCASALAQPAPFNYPAAGGGGGSSSCSGDINAACSQVLGVGNVTTGVLPATHGGTGQANAAGARGSAGLDIDELTGHGDSNYTILATDRVVATNAAFTAARVWTLPAASAVNAGQSVTILDAQGTVTGANTLTVARAGSDTINGGTSYVIAAAFNYATLVSDGVSKWTVAGCTAGCTFTGTTTFGGGTTVDATGNVHFNGDGANGGNTFNSNGWSFGSARFRALFADTANGVSFNPGQFSTAAEDRYFLVQPVTTTITAGFANQRFNYVGQNTITAASALNISTEATDLYVNGAPAAAASATITKAIGLHIAAGSSLTSGVTTGVGLKVDAPSGASANKAVEVSGHVEYTGTAPGVTAGTGATVTGNDMAGRVTVGTSPSTTVALTFNSSWTNAPVCFAQDETSAVTMRATTITTAAVTFTASASLTAADKVSYSCRGFF